MIVSLREALASDARVLAGIDSPSPLEEAAKNRLLTSLFVSLGLFQTSSEWTDPSSPAASSESVAVSCEGSPHFF